MMQRSEGFAMNVNEVVENYFERLLKLRIDVPLLLKCSVDCTYTSHRTQHDSGFSKKGESSPELAKVLPRYTNCIVTCVWAYGIVRLPFMMFIFDPVYRRDRSATDFREGHKENFNASCEYYRNQDRVMFC